MAFQSWILPTLIGLIAAILLVAILFKDTFVKQAFSDLGALIQLQTSRPYYYGLGWVPNNYNTIVPTNSEQGKITMIDSPLWVDGGVPYPVYNYYPKAPLNPAPSTTNANKKHNGNIKGNKKDMDLAFGNPDQTYNAHKAHYWALSGGYPYPLPIMILPPTDMDKVHGVEDKI